jgi:hypothetical protein
MRRGEPWRRNPTPQHPATAEHHQERARSFRTQQRAYDPQPQSRPRSPPTPRRKRAVLGADTSRRPNWSAFHPRAPSRQPATPPRRRHRLVPAWLCTDQTHPAGEVAP